MKNLPWIITILAFAAAIVIVMFKSKPSQTTYEAPKCPECPVCPVDRSAEVAALQAEVDRLSTENLDLKTDLAKAKRRTFPPAPKPSPDAPEKVFAFAEKLDTCTTDLEDAYEVIDRYAASDKVIRLENTGLRQENSILKSNLDALLNNRPVETPYVPDAPIEMPTIPHQLHSINLGVGYFDQPIYSAGYMYNLRKWFAVGGDALYGQDGQIGAIGKLSIRFGKK